VGVAGEGSSEETNFLRFQLEAKDSQIQAKDAQIAGLMAQLEQTTNALAAAQHAAIQAQALHAGTIQQQLPQPYPYRQEPVPPPSVTLDSYPDVMTRNDVMKYLCISKGKLLDLEQTGMIKRINGMGRKVLYSRGELDRFVNGI